MITRKYKSWSSSSFTFYLLASLEAKSMHPFCFPCFMFIHSSHFNAAIWMQPHAPACPWLCCCPNVSLCHYASTALCCHCLRGLAPPIASGSLLLPGNSSTLLSAHGPVPSPAPRPHTAARMCCLLALDPHYCPKVSLPQFLLALQIWPRGDPAVWISEPGLSLIPQL